MSVMDLFKGKNLIHTRFRPGDSETSCEAAIRGKPKVRLCEPWEMVS